MNETNKSIIRVLHYARKPLRVKEIASTPFFKGKTESTIWLYLETLRRWGTLKKTTEILEAKKGRKGSRKAVYYFINPKWEKKSEAWIKKQGLF